jgi:hypothetical protein
MAARAYHGRRFSYVWNPPYRYYCLTLWRWRPVKSGAVYTRRFELSLHEGTLELVVGSRKFCRP